MEALYSLLTAIYSSQLVTYLIALILGNLLLGVVASLRQGDFALTLVSDWLWNRVIPLLAGYGVAAALAYVQPSLYILGDVAFATLAVTLLGYILRNLSDIGIPIPNGLTKAPEDYIRRE